MNGQVGPYQVVDLSPGRRIWINTLELSWTPHAIYGLLDVDVTVARKIFAGHKERTGESLSFTAFLTCCLARAVEEDKGVQAYLKGRRQLVLFDGGDDQEGSGIAPGSRERCGRGVYLFARGLYTLESHYRPRDAPRRPAEYLRGLPSRGLTLSGLHCCPGTLSLSSQCCCSSLSSSEAVNHALAAGDLYRAARLIEDHWLAMVTRGELTTLLRWIDALPDDVAHSRPWLCIHQAWALTLSGKAEVAEPLLQQIESQVPAQASTPEEHEILRNVAAMRTRAGHVRVFVAQGAPMATLLQQAAAHGIAAHYTRDLLAALNAGDSETAAMPSPPHPPSLVKPLTPRELATGRLPKPWSSPSTASKSTRTTSMASWACTAEPRPSYAPRNRAFCKGRPPLSFDYTFG